MKDRLYKTVVLLSFLILIWVQLRLTYNTYVLQDREYSLKEKKLINDEYGRSISDDKLYKGAGHIIDSVLSANMPLLKSTYFGNPKAFKSLSLKVSEDLLRKLRSGTAMDSTFKSIVSGNDLNKELKYLLTFESIEINFDQKIGNIYILNSISDISKNIPTAGIYGFIIGGTLNDPGVNNRVTNLSVSGKLIYDYRVTFNLFVDAPDRPFKVAMEMLPVFSLVAICIIIIVGINYYTYVNWMRQKKETEAKSDFLNSIKHEFNTPITTILVASKSLDEDEVLNDRSRVKALVHIVERQALRLHSHINQMLEVSEINNHINLEETDLNYTILTIVNDFKIKVKPPDSLNFDPLDIEVIVNIDPFVFTTMLQNMLDNSFKHNQSAVKTTEVVLTETNQDYILHIKDNGKGIEEVNKVKIFDKFFREQRVKSGLGLGLYYVKQCLDLHGWKVNVRSEPGTGTDFMVHIPKNKKHQKI